MSSRSDAQWNFSGDSSLWSSVGITTTSLLAGFLAAARKGGTTAKKGTENNLFFLFSPHKQSHCNRRLTFRPECQTDFVPPERAVRELHNGAAAVHAGKWGSKKTCRWFCLRPQFLLVASLGATGENLPAGTLEGHATGLISKFGLDGKQ